MEYNSCVAASLPGKAGHGAFDLGKMLAYDSAVPPANGALRAIHAPHFTQAPRFPVRPDVFVSAAHGARHGGCARQQQRHAGRADEYGVA